MKKEQSRRRKLHYGWIVTLGCTLIYFYGLGLTSNVISLFVEPVIEALELTKTQGSSLLSVQYAFGIVGLLAGGEYYKRGDARKGVFFCGTVIALGYVLLGVAKSLWICYVGMAFIGFGYGGGVFVPASLMITRWFVQRRGISLAIAACGSGLSTILFPPVIQFLMNGRGMLFTFLFQSGTILLLSLLGFVLVRNDPADKGMHPYGAESIGDDQEEISAPTDSSRSGDTIGWLALLRNRNVIRLLLAVSIIGMVVIPINSHLKIFYSSSGYSPMRSAAMISVSGAMMLVGKPVFGAIVDRIGTKKASLYIYCMIGTAAICGLLIRRYTCAGWMFPVLMGLSSALSPMATPLWAVDVCDGRYYSQIYTCTRIAFTLGGSCSLVLPGMMADLTGYYTPVLFIYLALILISFFILRCMYAGKEREKKAK